MNYTLSSSKRKTTDCARANFCDHFSLLPMWHLLLRCASNILNFARSRWIKNTNCLAESLMLHLSIAKHTQFLVEHHSLLWWINGLHIARCRPAFSVVWNYLNQDIRLLVFPKSHLASPNNSSIGNLRFVHIVLVRVNAAPYCHRAPSVLLFDFCHGDVSYPHCNCACVRLYKKVYRPITLSQMKTSLIEIA